MVLSNYDWHYTTLWLFTSYIGLIFFFKSVIRTTTFQSQLIILSIIAFVESIISLLQFTGFLKSENEFFNVMGTFINPNFLGIHMAIGLVALISLIAFFYKNNKIAYIIYGIMIIPMLFILINSESRASWLSLIIGIFALLLTSKKFIFLIKKLNTKRKIIYLFLIISASSIAAYFLYEMEKDSLSGRGLILKLSLSEIKENPLFGQGLFNFAGVYNESKAKYFLSQDRPWNEIKVANYVSTAFNDYILILFEIGAIGFILLLAGLTFLIKDTKLTIQTRFAMVIIIIMLFLGFFTSVIYNPSIMIIGSWAIATLLSNKNYPVKILVADNEAITKIKRLILFSVGVLGVTIFLNKTLSLYNFKRIMDLYVQKSKDISGSQLYNKCKAVTDNPHIEFRIGNELFWDGYKKKGVFMMNNAIRKSNIPGMNYAISIVYEHLKENQKVEYFLKKNTGIEPFKFKSKIDLMDFYGRTGQLKKQEEIAKEIIELPVKIPSKEVDEYKKRAQEVLSKTQ